MIYGVGYFHWCSNRFKIVFCHRTPLNTLLVTIIFILSRESSLGTPTVEEPTDGCCLNVERLIIDHHVDRYIF